MNDRPQPSTDHLRYHLPASGALISIFGFWLFYVLIVTLRANLMDFPAQGELALRRLYVTMVGMLLTILLWQILRLFDGRKLTYRVLVAAIACIPIAYAFASVNYYFFNIFDQASLMDIEQVREHNSADEKVWMEIVEVAVSRYFFLIAWSALYLALSYAHIVRLAERRAAAFERAAQLSELRALRYQLNPHFLFNTLNSLSALVMGGRRDEAEDVILNLANFYRTSLSGDPSGDVALADEIELQRLYLGIEGVRFPDRLKVLISVSDEAGQAAVPGLILQPLVENAIKHGVSRTIQPVNLAITAKVEDGKLVVKVTDDAPSAPDDSGTGLGLANVRDRLQARFGDAATLHAGPINGGGFDVTLILPLVRHD